MNDTVGILGCGYLGSRAAAFWKGLGLSVIGFTRSLDKEADVLSSCHAIETSLEALIQNVDCLLVSVAPQKNTVESYQETYLGVANRIVAILNNTPPNKLNQILYTSSASVYGEQAGGWVSEKDPLFPLTEQAKILLETERIFLQIRLCKVAIFRIGELTGPGREIRDRLQARQDNPFPGTGSTFANLTPVHLLIRGLEFARQRQLRGIFNLCSTEHPTRKILYDQIAKEHNLPPPLWDANLFSAHAGNKRLCCKKLESLGFQIT